MSFIGGRGEGAFASNSPLAPLIEGCIGILIAHMHVITYHWVYKYTQVVCVYSGSILYTNVGGLNHIRNDYDRVGLNPTLKRQLPILIYILCSY